MSKIKILTDSTSDLRGDVLGKYDIRVIPLNVYFGEAEYKDGVDFTPGSFYERLKEDPSHPKTSQPSPADFQAIYSDMLADGSDVVSIHISSKMSGTILSASIAKRELQSERIHIIDSGHVSVPLGMIVVECAKAAQMEKNVSEVIGTARKLIGEIQTYFIVNTLEYLEKGGRIGKASAVIGGLLNIKPILTFQKGEISPFEKIRGSGKALNRLAGIFCNYKDENKNKSIKLGAAHAADPVQLQLLIDKLDYGSEHKNIFTTEVGSVVGSHCGPGTLAISFYPEVN